MGLFVSIIGIDGSGKSALTTALTDVLPAELGVVVAAVSDDLWCKSPDEDLLRPGFAPDGRPFAGRVSRMLRRAAKAAVNRPRLYPAVKLAHMSAQELAARHLASRHRPDLVLRDGNLVLSAAARAVNYSTLLSEASDADPADQIAALYASAIEGQPRAGLRRAVPGLATMAWLRRVDLRLGLGVTALPDALVVLDVQPEIALARLEARGSLPDRHENLADLGRARRMYLAAAEFYRRRAGEGRTMVIDVSELSIPQAAARIVDFIRTLPLPRRSPEGSPRVLGTPSAPLGGPGAVLRRILTFRYAFGYALPNLHRGSGRELAFPIGRLGRQFLREGYSADVMRSIYVQDRGRYGLGDRLFLGYALHRAVYHRLGIIEHAVAGELRERLAALPGGETLRVLSAPCGYALDILRPLAALNRDWRGPLPVHVLASDLDPHGRIERALALDASATGVELAFVPGDLTDPSLQERLARQGPYHLVLFVGLSSWIGRAELLGHLRWVAGDLLVPGGVLVADCFTPGAFALSGRHAGYQASYYSPHEFAALLHYAGFPHEQIAWRSGPNGINHVCLARCSQAPVARAVDVVAGTNSARS